MPQSTTPLSLANVEAAKGGHKFYENSAKHQKDAAAVDAHNVKPKAVPRHRRISLERYRPGTSKARMLRRTKPDPRSAHALEPRHKEQRDLSSYSSSSSVSRCTVRQHRSQVRARSRSQRRDAADRKGRMQRASSQCSPRRKSKGNVNRNASATITCRPALPRAELMGIRRRITCMYGRGCTRKDCWFKHEEPRFIDMEAGSKDGDAHRACRSLSASVPRKRQKHTLRRHDRSLPRLGDRKLRRCSPVRMRSRSRSCIPTRRRPKSRRPFRKIQKASPSPTISPCSERCVSSSLRSRRIARGSRASGKHKRSRTSSTSDSIRSRLHAIERKTRRGKEDNTRSRSSLRSKSSMSSTSSSSNARSKSQASSRSSANTKRCTDSSSETEAADGKLVAHLEEKPSAETKVRPTPLLASDEADSTNDVDKQVLQQLRSKRSSHSQSIGSSSGLTTSAPQKTGSSEATLDTKHAPRWECRPPVEQQRLYDLRVHLTHICAKAFIDDLKAGVYKDLCFSKKDMAMAPSRGGGGQIVSARATLPAGGHLQPPEFAFDPDTDALLLSGIPGDDSLWCMVSLLSKCSGIRGIRVPPHAEATSNGCHELRARFASQSHARAALSALAERSPLGWASTRVALLSAAAALEAIVVPREMSTQDRIQRDQEMSASVLRQLDGLLSVPSDCTEVLLAWGRSVEQQLDLQMLYLRQVHKFCFYSGTWCEDDWELRQRCGPAVIRHAPFHAPSAKIVGRAGGASGSSAIGMPSQVASAERAAHERRIKHFLSTARFERPQAPRDDLQAQTTGGVQEQKLVSEDATLALTKEASQNRFRCQICQKCFQAPHFVDMHVRRRHPDLLVSTSENAAAVRSQEPLALTAQPEDEAPSASATIPASQAQPEALDKELVANDSISKNDGAAADVEQRLSKQIATISTYLRPGKIRCGGCNKCFKDDKCLEAHMRKRHLDLLLSSDMVAIAAMKE